MTSFVTNTGKHSTNFVILGESSTTSFENLEKEVRHILEIFGLKQANITEIKTSKTSSKIPFFYSQLSKQLLNRLKRIFRRDSEMFEYDIPMSIFSGNSTVRRVSLQDQ